MLGALQALGYLSAGLWPLPAFNPRNGEAFLISSGENRTRNSQADAHSSGLKNRRRKSGLIF
jgi:hypothetical protein